MHNKPWIMLLALLSLAGCRYPARAIVTPAPVAATSAGLGIVPTATIKPATTPAPTLARRPSATPATIPPTRKPTSPPEPATPVPIELSPTPTRVSATDTALPPRQGPDPAAVRVELRQVLAGLDKPVGIANAADGSGRLFILEQVGRIRIVRNGAVIDVPFLDIADRVGSSGNEQGLLGLAFHPQYAANGFFFVNYTNRNGDTVVSRFSVGASADRADPGSEAKLLTVNQPAANHNGGHLAFGPDGYLYIGTGDGGGEGDPFGTGQNGQTLLAKMLRLDVNDGQPYAVPADNPFVGDAAVRDEIWATGLRNPWRYSFDRLTGDLYIADVGQDRYEEVDVQPAGSHGGQNYGWSIMEGTHCYRPARACDQAGLTLPVFEYDHSQGCSVTGGYVYRGQESPALAGIYLFGDYCSGRLWGLARPDGNTWRAAEVGQADAGISSFGEDESGEMYLVDRERGMLFKIVGVSK